MEVLENNQYTLIKLQESSFIEFEKRFGEINSNHIIVILSEDFNMRKKNISFFLETAKIQKINNLIKPNDPGLMGPWTQYPTLNNEDAD